MIKAEQFFLCTRNLGYSFVSGVPCSYLTPIINYAINHRDLTYVSAANEGDAVAMATGSILGGQRAMAMMQNSGLGNAVNPITSLLVTFRIPLLLIITLRGDPELQDEPQHELMGEITGSLLDIMKVKWDYFPEDPGELEGALNRAEKYMSTAQLPFAFVMRKDSVAPETLIEKENSNLRYKPQVLEVKLSALDDKKSVSRSDTLKRITEHTRTENCVIIATTGFTGRELYSVADRPNQIYMVGSMGCASSLALGMAITRPDLHIVIIDGDGAALMRMGNFATIGAYAPRNLTHILLDNGVHDSTGGQSSTAPGLSFAHIAAECGYALSIKGHSLKVVDELFRGCENIGPCFAQLIIRPGSPKNLPRPNLKPFEVKERLINHIGSIRMPPT